MTTARLENFSDAVLAIIITIGVLGLRLPQDVSFSALAASLPELLIYAWSFQMIGTYWINHHALVRSIKEPNILVMWANVTLLFFLSLVPFTTEWLGMHPMATLPSFAYCFVLLCAGVTFLALDMASLTCERHSGAAYLLRARTKSLFSIALYAVAVVTSFFFPLLSYIIVGLVSLVWLVPRRG